MPGLVGIISNKKPAQCERQISKMLASMQYEDFYQVGKYSNPEISSYVGWICHPKSYCDCMPVISTTSDVVLIFSGDVFYDKNQFIIEENEAGADNAKRLVRLYDKYGESFFEKLNGWFCGLLLDTRRKKAFLFNDRYGMSRIFIHEGKDGLYFSSEAKALLAVLPATRNFDSKGVGEYLTCGCTLGNRTLYKDITVLPAGSAWVFEHGEVVTRGSYFDRTQWIDQDHLDEKQFSNKMVESLGNIVKRYSRGALPVGISLTGGLDSRIVMACLDTSPGEFPCYTFGSMYRDTFDVQTAREVANACGQTHQVLVLGEKFISDFPTYLEKAVYISDGYLGMSGAAELYVNSVARSFAPVRLTGNYGGELLRGHCAFKHQYPKGDIICADLSPYLHDAKKTFQELRAADAVSFALFKQAPSQGYGRLAIEKSQVIPRTPFMDNDLVKLVYQAPPQLLKGEKLSIEIVSRYNPDLLKIPTDRGLLCNSTSLKSLTRRLSRRALIKAEYWSSHGMPNWLAAITGYGIGQILEKNFIGRDKFQHYRLWTQKNFSKYIKDALLQKGSGLDAFFNRLRVESIVHEHLAGTQNYTDEIDKLLTLSLGYSILFKNTPIESE